MRILRSFLLFLITVILLLTAVDFAASDVWGLAPHPVTQWVGRWLGAERLANPWVWRTFWIAAALLVAAVWLITIALWRRRTRPLSVRTSAGETVLIHPGALLKFVRLQVEGHPAVVAQRARVRQRPGGLGVWIAVSVQLIDSLPNIKHQLEERIRTGFAQVLGIDRLDELTIVISPDERSLHHRPGPTGTPEPKPEPPLRGVPGGEESTFTAGGAAAPGGEPGPATPPLTETNKPGNPSDDERKDI